MAKIMNKFGIGILVLVLGLLVPSSTYANDFSTQTAGWQTLHAGTYTIPGGTGYKETPIVESGGGNFQVCVSDLQAYNGFMIAVYEDDGTTNDTLVHLGYHHNNSASSSYCYTLYDIGEYVDGSNGKAEFYVRIGPADFTDTVYVVLND